MKTREEIDEMFRQYESKWGKLGHTSILHPERNIKHSGINKEEKTMSIMDNELYKFRQKVFNGKEANKVSHKSMVNVTELNRQYFEKVTTDGTLIHAQSPLYGEQRQHTKYYKREGEPGNYRYYYTKEEWDAAHNQKKNESAMEKVQRMHNEKEPNVNGMIKDGILYEKGEDGKFHKTDKKWEDVRQQAIEEADNEIIKAAKEGGYEAAKKAIFDDERMEEMFTQFEGGFENHGWELNDDDSVTGMDNDDEKYFKEMETWLRSFKNSTGIDIYKNPDFQKSVMDEIRKRYNLMKNQAKEREDIKNGNKKYAAPAGVGKKSTDKEVKHSALMTNSAMGDEIVDEYKAFQEKVKKGKEKNRLAHTATISPAMLNARYEEELSKKGILIHQANYKYYNKIDLGNGNTRYFYTKAEWDAYQREKGSKTNTNQKLSADTLKQIEQQKQKKANYDKNAEAAKHEGDRWQKKEAPKATVETVIVDVKKDPNFTKTVDTVKAAIDNGDIIYQNGKPIVSIDKKTGKLSEAGMKAQEAWQNLYKSFNDLSSKNKENGLAYEDVKGALMDAFNSELKKAQSSNKSGSDDKSKDSNPGNLGFDKMKEGMTQEEFDKALKDAKDSIDFDKMTNEISEVINDQFKNVDQSVLDGIKDQVAKETEKMLKNKLGF